MVGSLPSHFPTSPLSHPSCTQCLGLIGRNGAGKTTLLRMLNGLIKPDKGRIEMRGRVGALIALEAEDSSEDREVMSISQGTIPGRFHF